MKQRFSDLIQNVKQRHPKTLIILTVSLLVLVIASVSYSSISNKGIEAEALTANESPAGEDTSLVAVFGLDDATTTENSVSNNSWPGELVSGDISQIQPQREGVITEWNVHIGEYVSAGQSLGKISAPPATPELIKMLAEQTEAVTMARSQVKISDEYAAKEQSRLNSLRNSLDNNNTTSNDQLFTALQRLRDKVDIKKKAMRSFVERAISVHVTTVSSASTWRSFRYGFLNKDFGTLDQSMQYKYETALASLVDQMKSGDDIPVESAQTYFALAVRFANNSVNDSAGDFKTMTANDQNEFLTFLSEYKDAEAELADKETEYKIMISEKSAEVEKDRSMAYAGAKASESAYSTVLGQITGGSSIKAPRSGTVSAIYKKVGDLVGPEMAIAVVAGKDKSKLTVRIRIPSNTNRPNTGEVVSVIRPGYTKDIRQAKVLGVGTTLDETGSYLADAILIDSVDWPVGSSVRVVPVKNSNTPSIKVSSVWWSEGGLPHVWAITDAGRIFAKKITIGRTLGDSIEVTDGLKSGEKYVVDPTLEISEDMFLDDLIKKVTPSEETSDKPATSGKKKDDMEGMPGM